MIVLTTTYVLIVSSSSSDERKKSGLDNDQLFKILAGYLVVLDMHVCTI